jgi:hypothetical protein
MLREVAAAVSEGDAHHPHAEIGRGAERIAGEDAEAAAVGGHGLLEADLHREVGDGGLLVPRHRRIPEKL